MVKFCVRYFNSIVQDCKMLQNLLSSPVAAVRFGCSPIWLQSDLAAVRFALACSLICLQPDLRLAAVRFALGCSPICL